MTDSHCRGIGDYDALVIVQLAGFEEGELLLYERLQMTPMLLERYAKDGSEKSRRQMLAICQTDPEVLADVLGHFVELASEKLNTNAVCFPRSLLWDYLVFTRILIETLCLTPHDMRIESFESSGRKQARHSG